MSKRESEKMSEKEGKGEREREKMSEKECKREREREKMSERESKRESALTATQLLSCPTHAVATVLSRTTPTDDTCVALVRLLNREAVAVTTGERRKVWNITFFYFTIFFYLLFLFYFLK